MNADSGPPDVFGEIIDSGFNEYRSARAGDRGVESQARAQANRPMREFGREFLQVLKPRGFKEYLSLGARIASIYNPVYGVLLAAGNVELMAMKELRTVRNIRHKVEEIIGVEATAEAVEELKTLGVKNEEMHLIFNPANHGKDLNTRFLLDKLYFRQTAIGKVLGKDNQSLTQLNEKEKKAAMGVAVASVVMGIGIGLAVSKILESKLGGDNNEYRFGLERLGVMKSWGTVSHVFGSRLIGLVGERIVFKGEERTDENKAKIDEWIKTTVKIIESLNTAYYTASIMVPATGKAMEEGKGLFKQGIEGIKAGFDLAHDRTVIPPTPEAMHDVKATVSALLTQASAPSATPTPLEALTPTSPSTPEASPTIPVDTSTETPTVPPPTPEPTQESTELPTPPPTPEPTPVSKDFGWRAGQADNLDEILQEVKTDLHSGNFFIEHEGSEYYFLDDQSGPDVIVRDGYTYIKGEDGLFRLDLDGDGLLDANFSYNMESLVPPELRDDNQGSINTQSSNPSNTKVLASPVRFEAVSGPPPPDFIDTDGDGTDDIITHDGNYYLDTNNNGTIDDGDIQAKEAPVIRVDGAGNLLIDKFELVDGQLWFRDLSGKLTGVVKDGAGEWFIDRGRAGGDAVIGGEVGESEDVALAAAPENLQVVSVDEETGRYSLKVDSIIFANGSRWVFNEDGKVVEGVLSDGKTTLAFDNHGKGIMAFQAELAKLHPEWTPDQVAGEAAAAFSRGEAIEDLRNLTTTARDAGTGNVESGGETTWDMLRTDASGGRHGIIQGFIKDNTQMSASEAVLTTGSLAQQFENIDENTDLSSNNSFNEALNRQIARFALKHELENNFSDQGLTYYEANKAASEAMFMFQGDFDQQPVSGPVNQAVLGEGRLNLKINDNGNIVNWSNFDWEEWLRQHGYIK